MKQPLLRRILTIAAAGSVVAGGGVATAFAAPMPDEPGTAAAAKPGPQAIVCVVNQNNVPFYKRGSTTPDGYVHTGQKFNSIYEYTNGYRGGDLWGGWSDVSIWKTYMYRDGEPGRVC